MEIKLGPQNTIDCYKFFFKCPSFTHRSPQTMEHVINIKDCDC